MLIELIARQDPPCAGAAGERALARLAERLDPAAPPRLQVMAIGVAARHLRGTTANSDREPCAEVISALHPAHEAA